MNVKKFRTLKPKTLKFAVFDIETYKWINPYAVGFYDGETYTEFKGKKCIIDFLKNVIRKKYRAYTIFAHNGGRFDFNFLMEVLKHWGYDINMVFQGSRCILLKVYHQKEGKTSDRQARNATRFCDSYALLLSSLDNLTKHFNVKHKKLNFMDKPTDKKDFEYLYKLYKKGDSKFYNYLKNDVLGLYEVIKKFNDIIIEQNGIMSITIASTALKTFQSGFLKNPIKMTNIDTNLEMKKAYYGGRVEIFNMYLPEYEYYNVYDINSLYPFEMFNNLFPITKPKSIKNVTKNIICENLGITKAVIKTPKNLYLPVLPYRHELNKTKKLVFPLGKFTGYWDNSFLKKAYELGYKITPIKTYTFEGDMIFKDYIKTFYKLKNTSKKDTSSYILAKYMLNSLYGKFGQNQESEILMKINNPKDLLKYDVTDVVDNNFNLFKIKTESKGNFFIPQISIHIITLAQLHLYEIMLKLIEKGFTVGYCDTDSIFTNAKLNTSDKLGDLKLEDKFYKGYFLLPKTYCIVLKDGKTKIRAKGYINDFQKQLSINTFKNALFKNDYSGFKLESEGLKFNSMKASHVRHKTFVSTDKLKKSINIRYDKRVVLKNFDTKPLIICGEKV